MSSNPQKSLSFLAYILLAGAALGVGACASRAVDVAPDSSGGLAGAPALSGPCAGNTSFQVGSGVYDITGPAAELGMMGYGRIDQKTAGIHLRLRARAFVIATPCNGKRVAFVSADVGQVFQVIKQQVMAKLQTAYGSTYTDANVILNATHTHSGPGGDSHYALYNLTILGFDQQNLDTVVHGIYQAIVRALGGMPRFHTAALIPQAGELLAAEETERGRRVVLVVEEGHLLSTEQLEDSDS